MLRKRDKTILKRIVKYCDDIKLATVAFGDSVETLKENVILWHAVSMCILQIGELAHHLTTEFTKSHSQIPWKNIIKMRHIAAHHYEKFDVEIVRDAIINDVPALRDYCRKLLDDNVVET